MIEVQFRDEYAVCDDRGELFGLPVRTFANEEAARKVLEFLTSQRADMNRNAGIAQKILDSARKPGFEESARLKDTVARWQREKERVFTVVQRQVSPWKAVAP